MGNDSHLQIEIDIAPGELADEQLEKVTQTLLRQLHSLEEVDNVERELEIPEAGVKGGTGRSKPGKLKVAAKKLKELIQFLGGYLPSNRIKITVKGKDKSFVLELPGNRSQKDILQLMEKARVISA
ncbi:MAG: hypothetical protein GY862_09825 [Gammaproteobacteria bacterium]|nr:hypothetical protein [Gammaproteobacteria bacterium]